MKVLMYPGRSPRDGNRYLDILAGSLRRLGVDVQHWNQDFGAHSHADVFHVHWPELIAEIGSRPRQLLRGHWILRRFRMTLERIRKAGGAVVWTVHNLAPHDARLQAAALLRDTLRHFLPNVDLIISMTASGIPAIRATFPELSEIPAVVARHPHYRDDAAIRCVREQARQALGLPTRRRILAHIGDMRANKRLGDLARAFSRLPAGDWHLLLAGGASPTLRAELDAELEALPNVSLVFRRLSESEVAQFHVASDVIVMPGRHQLNSGTLLAALSHDVPVIARQSAPNLEIQQEVGAQWLRLFDEDLDADSLQLLLHGFPDTGLAGSCRLDAFDPTRSAKAHLEAYRAALARRGTCSP